MTPLTSKRILILDDDIAMRTMLGLLLTGQGYEVMLVSDSLEAISLHRQKPFDLVILELVLNGSDGFETFTKLRDVALPTKFIAISKSTWVPTEVHLKMARQIGAHETLAKPFTAEQMLDAVRNALGAH
jgi:DNA-binding response OmpR family regulator